MPTHADVPNEGLPSPVGKDVRAHFDGERHPVVAETPPFHVLHPLAAEERGLGRLQPGGVLRGDYVEGGLPDELLARVAEHPARGFVDVGQAGVEIGEEERVGRGVDDLTDARRRPGDLVVLDDELAVGVLEVAARAVHEPREVDDHQPVDRVEQRLEACLGDGVSGAHDEEEGRDRQADEERAQPGPRPGVEARHERGAEEEHEGRPRARERGDQDPQGECDGDRGERKEIPRHRGARREATRPASLQPRPAAWVVHDNIAVEGRRRGAGTAARAAPPSAHRSAAAAPIRQGPDVRRHANDSVRLVRSILRSGRHDDAVAATLRVAEERPQRSLIRVDLRARAVVGINRRTGDGTPEVGRWPTTRSTLPRLARSSRSTLVDSLRGPYSSQGERGPVEHRSLLAGEHPLTCSVVSCIAIGTPRPFHSRRSLRKHFDSPENSCQDVATMRHGASDRILAPSVRRAGTNQMLASSPKYSLSSA
jgi:hypothetical protein